MPAPAGKTSRPATFSKKSPSPASCPLPGPGAALSWHPPPQARAAPASPQGLWCPAVPLTPQQQGLGQPPRERPRKAPWQPQPASLHHLHAAPTQHCRSQTLIMLFNLNKPHLGQTRATQGRTPHLLPPARWAPGKGKPVGSRGPTLRGWRVVSSPLIRQRWGGKSTYCQAQSDQEEAVPEPRVRPSHGKRQPGASPGRSGEGDAPGCSAQEQLLGEAVAQSC